ncbi:MAG TPA: hypothetical protein VK597_11350, partial [Inquilinus sp.]|nr:hypothetical protein [Inquilinus sp.]
MTMTVPMPGETTDRGIADDQARAKQASARRRRRQWRQLMAIRMVSLAIMLVLWQVVGAQIDPILFTTPIAVAKAAVLMIGSGELWRYLGPSLLVFVYGLALAAVF